jgi:hypothetical protein
MTSVAGSNGRERQSSFLEPLELEDLDGPQEEDPSVFDRVTAIPGELPTLVPQGEPPPAPPPQVDTAPAHPRVERPLSGPPASSIHAASTPTLPPLTANSEPPPVLGGPASSNRRPRRAPSRPPRSPSRPGIERPARRPSTPRQNAAEIAIELADVPPTRPQQAPRGRDALEAELSVPVPGPAPGSAPAPSHDPEVVDMKDRYATGDFSGALVIAEGILETVPDHDEALRCQARCTEVLSQMYLARLGSLRQVVQVALSAEQIRWLSLDHRAGFLLSLVDGISSIEELLDISSMPRLEALRILYGLLDQRVIALSG